MKNKISPFVYEFLDELSQHNNREWFMDNKKRWEVVKSDFLEFINFIIPELYQMDKTIGMQTSEKCMYRIYRDTRFSPDKTPYKTHIAVYIASGGVKQHGRPGYYLHIQNGQSGIGGGIYMPEPIVLDAIRKEIYYNIDTFKSILNAPEFKRYFPGLMQIDMLKRAPKGFPNDFADIDLLKYKHYATSHDFSNEIALSDHFHEYVMNVFHATYPLNKFILNAMN